MATDIKITVKLDAFSKSTLLPIFREKGVDYKEVIKTGSRTFVVNDGSSVVEILNALSGLGLTGALVAWLNGRANRKIEVFKPDGLHVITKGISVKDTEKIINQATKLHATEDQ